MNLLGDVIGFISSINPMVQATVQKSTGYTTNADGTQVPTYTTLVANVQVQGLVEREFAVLHQVDNQSMNSVNRKMFAFGSINMNIRAIHEGGDILQIGTTYWKVVRIFETWPDWCAVVIRQQLNP
jgi:hypothetical protein